MTPPPELIVGQRLNSSSKSVAAALRARDSAFLQALAKEQADAGATALDLNVSAACALSKEPELLTWLAGVAEQVTNLPLCLDSGDLESLAAAASTCRVSPIVNSLSPDQIGGGVLDRFDWGRDGLRVVVLCARRELVLDAQTRLDCADFVAGRLMEWGLREESLIFDPLMFPKLSGLELAETMFDVIRRLRERWPRAGIMCAAGNYSHGLADRRSAERECVSLSRYAGANVFLCDPRVFPYSSC